MTDKDINNAIALLDSGIDQLDAAMETIERERDRLEKQRSKLSAARTLRQWDNEFRNQPPHTGQKEEDHHVSG